MGDKLHSREGLTEASLDGIENLIGHGAVLGKHTVCLGVHLLCHFPVLQALGVDEDVEGRSLQSSLAAHSTAAGIGNSQAAALGSENTDILNRLAAQLHNLHGSGAGNDGSFLHHLVPIGMRGFYKLQAECFYRANVKCNSTVRRFFLPFHS